VLAGVIVIGTAGYMALEGWGLWDAFYMTAITVTTVGYKEVHELSRTGQVFTVVLMFGGVGTVLYIFTLMAAVIVEGGLPKRLLRRRLTRMLDRVENHFIVCGYGRIGGIVAAELQRENIPFVVIERDSARVSAAQDREIVALAADASREDVLQRAGISRARGLIAAVGTDADNVYTVMTARGLRPDLFIVGRAESDSAIKNLQRAGADRIISPYQIGAVQMAQSAIRPAVVDFIELATSSTHLELAMEEISVAAGSTLADRSVRDANLGQRYDLMVVAIQRESGAMEFNPAAEATIRAGDKLVVIGRPDSLKQLDSKATS
jgi:voltage-gated potassium channel